MLRFLRPLVLFAAAAGLTAAAVPAAPAQVKDKKDDKTKVDPKAAEVGTIEVYQAKDGWRFKVVVDGKAIAIGTVGQDTKADALKVVEALKATMAKGKVEVIDDKKK
ncbi:MAG: hypothetical protein C0501_00155 [Isosphaera sp.]|nr:hypothetical protein [Isosphaera sp.]